MDTEKISARLWIMALARATRPASAWLMAVLGRRDLGAGLVEAFSGIGRKVGQAPVELTDLELSALREAGVDGPLEGWGLDDLCRAALLVTASLRLSPARFEGVLGAIRVRGDERERRAAELAARFLQVPA